MKKIFLLSMMAVSNITSFAYDFVSNGIYYDITSEANLTVEVTYQSKTYDYPAYYNACLYSGSITIPETVVNNGKTYTVTGIGPFAFGTTDGIESLKSYMYKLYSIDLPSTIEYIANGAFYCCVNLKKISLPANLKKIGNYAFYGCNIVSMIIPSGVNDIGNEALSQSVKTVIMLPYTPPTGFTSNCGATTAEFFVPIKKLYSNNKIWKSYNTVEMLSPNSFEYVYNGKEQVADWTNNLSTYTMNISDVHLEKNAGNYSTIIMANFYREIDMSSFTVEFPYEYTINKAKLNVRANNASRIYGEDNPEFSILYSGLVGDENESVFTIQPTVWTNAYKTSKVGEYPININGGNSLNYELTYESGVLTITKAPLSAKVNDVTKEYGSQNPAFTIGYYGLKNNESVPTWDTRPTFQTDATQSSGVGQYVVNAVNGVPVNYELEAITAGTLEVTPAALTIKANDAVRQYYSDEPNFSYTCNGFVNGEDENVLTAKPVLSTTATRTSNAGDYEIKVGETSTPNYSISYVNGTLTITPRTLTALVGNYERVYNEENPVFEVMYDGFVENENENVLNKKAVAMTSATKTSDVGTYNIDVTGGSADNYTFSYSSGSLTINKAEQAISWDQDLTGLIVGDQVELKAEASSGLPITYTMDNTNAAEIYSTGNKSYLDCKAGGQFRIRAVQDGNKNYYSSPRASNTISIIGANPESDPTLTIKQADNGSVKVQVSKGSVYTFIIAPDNGWNVHSVTFNNMDVTSQLSSDGSFTTPTIDSNSTLSVVYEQVSSAVNAIKSSEVKVQATSDGIRVVDANMGDTIRIYTYDGLQQHSVKVDEQIIDVPLTKHDVYIVKVGDKTVKLGY